MLSFESPKNVHSSARATATPISSKSRDISVRSPLSTPLTVMKFGGTSVADADCIQRVAQRALAAQKQNQQVVLVVSAMAGETNRLLALAGQVATTPALDELDAALATGEQLAAALTAIAIRAAGGRARSLTAAQLGLFTDDTYGNARVTAIDSTPLQELLQAGEIPVIAGFQGITSAGRTTTLGRGGSDTTAVAIAAALGAATCEIYTDVDGVFTADPRICPRATILSEVNLDDMQSLAGLGAKVLHDRSVGLADRHKVLLHVRSSRHDRPGSFIGAKVRKKNRRQFFDDALEAATVKGLSLDKNIVRINLPVLAKKNLAGLCDLLTATGIPLIYVSKTHILAKRADLPRIMAAVSSDPGVKTSALKPDLDLAQVSLVGSGLLSDAKIFATIGANFITAGIDIDEMTAFETRLSLLVKVANGERALQTLHSMFFENKKDLTS